MWPVVKARARFDSIPRNGLAIQHVAKAAVLSLSVLLQWQLPAQWLLLPEERAVHPKSGAFFHWVFIRLVVNFSRRTRHGSTVLNCVKLLPLLYLALPTLHCSMWQLHIITNQSVEVAARAEVAPGEKVVGIDLGTTNSAVAAMEVLKLSDYLKIWPLKMLSVKWKNVADITCLCWVKVMLGNQSLSWLRGWFSYRDPKRRGCTHHTQRCGVLQEWRALGGPDCQASGQWCIHCRLMLWMETGRCEFFSECLFQRSLCFWQGVVNPENTFYSVKRFVGRQPNEVEEELKEVSYKVDFEGQKVKIDCPVMSKKFAPEEVSAQVLRKLSADAGKYLSATVQKVTWFYSREVLWCSVCIVSLPWEGSRWMTICIHMLVLYIDPRRHFQNNI